MWDPIKKYTVDIINSVHRSDLTLKAEIIKKVIGVAILLITACMGVKAMAYGAIVYSFFDMFIIFHYSKKAGFEINFISVLKQISTILLSAFICGMFALSISLLFKSQIAKLIIGLLAGIIVYLILSYFISRNLIMSLLEIADRMLKRI